MKNSIIPALLAAIMLGLFAASSNAGPVVEVFQSMPGNFSFTKGAHGQVTCDTDGELIAITSGTVLSAVSNITLCNPDPDIVRVYSGNGNAISQGTPFCSGSTCAGVCVVLDTGPNIWRCATDSSTQAVFLLGGK